MADKFRTGDDPVAGSRVYLITLPNAQWFVREFSDLMADIADQNNWEAAGAVTIAEAAAAGLETYFSLALQNEPPFAEDAEELDGQPEQPWYDTLSDWIIAGFLAITFTPTAAIIYQTTIPKMRIAFRKGDIGAAFKVLLNSLEMWTGDSYGPIPDILSNDLDLQQFALDNDLGDPPWELKIVHDGDPGEKLEVIRNPLPVTIESVAHMVGEVLWGAWSAVPDHCLACDGAQYLKADYAALWAVLDAAYEDDSTHFHVPDLRGRAVLGNGQGSGLSNRAIDDAGGAETHQLSTAELPAHQHWAYNQSALSYQWSTSAGADGYTVAGNSSTGSVGGDEAHNNMQPFGVLRAVIVFE